MRIFLTGTTGYVGKHLLRYLLISRFNVTVCIRPKKGLTGKERFEDEIASNFLFRDLSTASVRVIEKDVNDLVEEDLSGCDTVIHCAANVKFTSSMEELMRENVFALQRIYGLSSEKRFVYISTCYVHPKKAKIRKAENIESGLVPSEFICDYAYTKYLAEDFLYSQTGDIDILRLSCVGAPLEKLPPMRGGAHLSIIEAILRSSIPEVWVPLNLVFSVVPVDIVCREIINTLHYSEKKIKQICASSRSKTYNVSFKNFISSEMMSLSNIHMDISFEEFKLKVAKKYWLFPSTYKKIVDINKTISFVSDNIYFESDVDIPEIGAEKYENITLNYVKLFILMKPNKLTVQNFFYHILTPIFV
jgi:nucleoside-diphosphate-sugar epimerase